jgi:hypothetical protein
LNFKTKKYALPPPFIHDETIKSNNLKTEEKINTWDVNMHNIYKLGNKPWFKYDYTKIIQLIIMHS